MIKKFFCIISLSLIICSCGCKSVEFTWLASTNAAGYKLCIGPQTRGSEVNYKNFQYPNEIDVNNVTRYIVDNFEEFFESGNQEVYISVVAYNDFRIFGPYSNEIQVNVKQLE